MDRRDLLRGAVALGCVALSGKAISTASANDKMTRFEQQGGNFSWKPHKLNPTEVADLAHAAYHHNGFG